MFSNICRDSETRLCSWRLSDFRPEARGAFVGRGTIPGLFGPGLLICPQTGRYPMTGKGVDQSHLHSHCLLLGHPIRVYFPKCEMTSVFINNEMQCETYSCVIVDILGLLIFFLKTLLCYYYKHKACSI